MIGVKVPTPEPADDTLPEANIYVETMMLALESDNGMAVDVATRKDGVALRHRFYKARKKEMDRGNHSLDSITITMHPNAQGFELHLKKLPWTTRML